MAHLMRRAGFGATQEELDAYMAEGHEAVVGELLHPGDPQNMPDDIIRRYHVGLSELRHIDQGVAYWLYRMITTQNPLEEKVALFWHGLFATSFPVTYRVFQAPEVLVNGAQCGAIEIKLPVLTAALTCETLALG